MKLFLFMSIISFSSIIFAYPFEYKCDAQDGYIENFDLKIVSEKSILINDVDKGTLDEEYTPQSPGNMDYKMFYGYFDSIGEGEEGYSLSLLLNSYLMRGSEFGYLKIRAVGEGYFSYFYKCTLK